MRKPVWNLTRDSTGLCVRFVTDSPTIEARWTLNKALLAMPHMPATGVSGLDLYAKADDGKWRWLAVGQPKVSPTNSVRLVTGLPKGPREYLLYLPLYNGVSSVEIGIPKDRQIAKAEPRPEALRKPIVFYGTSITQGGCASRPGMVHTAILGRQLNRPVINLGFSGNGKMEPELADLLAELDPAVYVLDCLPNMTRQGGRGARRAVRADAPQGASRHADRPGRGPELHQRVHPGFPPREERAQPRRASRPRTSAWSPPASRGCTTCPARTRSATTARGPWTARTRPISASCGWPTPLGRNWLRF